MTAPGPIPRHAAVLIEPYAGRPAGHWHQALTALAHAAEGRGTPAVVVVLNGITTATRESLASMGAIVAVRPPARCAKAWLLLAAGRAAGAAAGGMLRATRRFRFLPAPVRRAPHQITMVSRCLVEAASLRTGTALVPGAPQVIMTASETLHFTAAAWGSAPHLRIVHEVFTTEDLLLRTLTAVHRGRRDDAGIICPTAGVAASVRRRFPGTAPDVMPYALTAPGDYLSQDERASARAALSAAPGSAQSLPAAVFPGGWWPHKDPATVIEAFAKTSSGWRLLIAGHPLDQALLGQLAGCPRIRLEAEDRDLPQDEMRRLYAAADVAVISRRAAADKESGILMDAVRHGVPVIVSDSDPGLTTILRDRPWARIFRAGDSAGLAAVLDEAASGIPQRPAPEDAAAWLGLPTPEQALTRFTSLHTALITRKDTA